MSDRPRPPARGLDALIGEAKQDLTPRVTDEAWSALEERIVARMAEEPAGRAPAAAAPRPNDARRGNVFRIVRVGAFALAAAAAIVVMVKSGPSAVTDGVATSAFAPALATASSLLSTEGEGEVRVGGQLASTGHMLRAGDVLETGGAARALLERPRKVAWLLERAPEAAAAVGPARARVKSAGEALILALEDGAIEAQVTPVPSGEAFAVDIATGSSLVRVAVHGTHLRVSRSGTRVVVDLTEGVVSIGVPPRTGSTYGTLVTAPSHVEFDAADLAGTLRIDHTVAAVRVAIPLSPNGSVGTSATRGATEPVGQLDPPSTTPPVVSPVAPATVPRPTAPRSPTDPSHVEPVAHVDPATPKAPREGIAAAVRACAAARSRPENVRVTVTSSLKLRIGARGDVESAQFDPPLLPEIQTCAATAIYKAKLEDAAGGTVAIPINFSY